MESKRGASASHRGTPPPPVNGDTLQNVARFNSITKFAFATTVGYIPGNPNKQNQDSFILTPNLGNIEALHFFGVCDGHGMNGHHVSHFIRDTMPGNQCIFTHIVMLLEDMKRGNLQSTLGNKYSDDTNKMKQFMSKPDFHANIPISMKTTFNTIHA